MQTIQEKWSPCLQHKWDNLIARHHKCIVCGAVGWSMANSPAAKQKFGSHIHLFKCPSCGGATQNPQEECPNCKNKDKELFVSRNNKNVTWNSLPDSGKEAILFLIDKQKPSTVSRSNGAGSLPVLLRLGLVRKAGDRYGQSLWELTDDGRNRFLSEIENIQQKKEIVSI